MCSLFWLLCAQVFCQRVPPHIIASAFSSLVDSICDKWQFSHLKSSLLYWLSFCNHESYLHKIFSLFLVDCLLSFFLWVMFIHAFICLVLLIDSSYPCKLHYTKLCQNWRLTSSLALYYWHLAIRFKSFPSYEIH
jgi:hypothetical protein